jgi:hypothetical protein
MRAVETGQVGLYVRCLTAMPRFDLQRIVWHCCGFK